MIEDITEAIPEQWTRQTDSCAPAWMGAFTRTAEILIAVRGCSQETTLFFGAGPGGQLQRVQSEAGLVSYCIFQRVRILGAHGRVWHVDPNPDVVASSPEWRLWAWESRPLARLQWDPGEWHWRDPFAAVGSPPIPFFRYLAQLGRHILLAGRQATPAAAAEH